MIGGGAAPGRSILARARLPAGLLLALLLVTLAAPLARGEDLLLVLRKLTLYLGLLFAVAVAWALAPAPLGRLARSLDGGLDRAGRALDRPHAGWILLLPIFAYALVWGIFSILRHQALNSSGFDLAIQHQVVWNLAHRRPFESSIEVANYLGDHVALTLPAFAPLLWIWDDVRILLVAQGVVLALGAWPIYRLAARRSGGPLTGLVWAAAYLATPAVGFMNRYDFHDLVLALPLLLAAIDAVDEGRWGRATVWMILAAATREEVGLAVAFLGLWSALARRRFLWGLCFFVGGIVWSAAALYVVIPHFRAGAASDTLARYGWLGGGPGEILDTLLTEPWRLFTSSYHRVRRALFPAQLLWPYGGLSLLSLGCLAPGLPNLALSLTSSAVSQNSIYFQYNAPILPFVIWSALRGWTRLRSAGRSRGMLLLLLLFSLLAANWADPALLKDVGRPYTIVDGTRPRHNLEAFRQASLLIPRDADLLASNNLAPHFSARRDLFILHTKRENRLASWAMIDLSDRRHLESRADVDRLVARWIQEGTYAPRFLRDGILVLERGGTEDPDAAAALRRHLDEVPAVPAAR